MQPFAGKSRSTCRKDRSVNHLLKSARLLLILAAAVGLSGCGVAAFPVRTTSAAAKIVPVAGDVVAYPLDKTADTID